MSSRTVKKEMINGSSRIARNITQNVGLTAASKAPLLAPSWGLSPVMGLVLLCRRPTLLTLIPTLWLLLEVRCYKHAVMMGTKAGIACVMKRLRGKDDVQSRYGVAGTMPTLYLHSIGAAIHEQNKVCFPSQSLLLAFKAISSLPVVWAASNPATNALTSGLFFTIVQGRIFKVGEKFSKPPSEDVYYSKTRSMLSNLGLQNYEKNFKNGLLNDSTLPLLTDSALRDVKIPHICIYTYMDAE
ncbi:hypothetical protein C2S52_001839 [Perilla frutescens var. hirtella]|nr:hypothetical protein C2S52_001839 [Perilla frutescens var. hirtella]